MTPHPTETFTAPPYAGWPPSTSPMPTAELLGWQLKAELRGAWMEAELEQRLHNPGCEPVELVYTFPLPWGAVLLGVEAELGEHRLFSRVMAKPQAKDCYEQALGDGDAAILLETNPDRSHSLNLGNLAAGERALIRLRWAQALSRNQNHLRLMIPTVIAPRWGDPLRDGGLAPHQVADPDWQARHRMDLRLRLHGELALARLDSPSHRLCVQHTPAPAACQPGTTTVSLANAGWLDRDFVLNIGPLTSPNLCRKGADHSAAEPTTALLMSLCPRLPQRPPHPRQPRAVKLLVDCSGSMAGDSIGAARRALARITQDLPDGTRFSLTRFGSRVEAASDRLWTAGPASRHSALAWAQRLQADLGGTEMASALSALFAQAPGVPADVLMLTDGEIHGIEALLDHARRAGQRVFAVGIGSSPAEAHLRRLAEASGGACEFVAPGEAVEPAVTRMAERLQSPRFGTLTLEWPAGVVPLWVSALPGSVFVGDALELYALLPPDAPLPEGARLRLLATSPDGSPGSPEGGPAQVLAELALSGPLEPGDSPARLVAARRCEQHLGADATSAAQALTLALTHQLLTEQTAVLMVHSRAEADKAPGMPALQTIRPMLAAGWAGAGTVLFSSAGPLPAPACTEAVCMAPPPFITDTPTLPDPFASSTRWRTRRAGAPSQSSTQTLAAPMRHQPAPGLSPSALRHRLRRLPPAQWPQTWAALLNLGLDAGVLTALTKLAERETLRSGVSEATLVAAFLQWVLNPDGLPLSPPTAPHSAPQPAADPEQERWIERWDALLGPLDALSWPVGLASTMPPP